MVILTECILSKSVFESLKSGYAIYRGNGIKEDFNKLLQTIIKLSLSIFLFHAVTTRKILGIIFHAYVITFDRKMLDIFQLVLKVNYTSRAIFSTLSKWQIFNLAAATLSPISSVLGPPEENSPPNESQIPLKSPIDVISEKIVDGGERLLIKLHLL